MTIICFLLKSGLIIVQIPNLLIRRFFLSYTDTSSLIDMVKDESWQSVFNSTGPVDAYDNFISTSNNYILLSQKRFKFKNKPLKPWMTISLLKFLDKKNKIGNLIKKHPSNKKLIKYFDKLSKKWAVLIKNA